MRKTFAILLILSLTSAKMMAQDSLLVITKDSVVIESPDTVLLKSYAARYDPRKALLFAAVLPGLGQIYNKKYWKLPLVYGGFFGLGYAINFYQSNYKKYKVLLFYNLEHGLEADTARDPNDPLAFTTGQLRTIVDKSRRERDFFTIMMGAMYLLQIVDAHVDAHLKEFDLNPNLKVSIQPSVSQDEMMGEIFEIRMNYWNTCNPFPARPPVTETARIRIVAQPAPPSGNNQTVCNGTTPSNFSIGDVPVGATVNEW